MGAPWWPLGAIAETLGHRKEGEGSPNPAPHTPPSTPSSEIITVFSFHVPLTPPGHTACWGGWLPTWGFPGDVDGPGQQTGWT